WRKGALRRDAGRTAGAAAIPQSGLGELRPDGYRDSYGARKALTLPRVEQRHGGVDHDLDEARAVVRKGVCQRSGKLGRFRHPRRLAAMALRQPDEVEAGQFEPGYVAHLHDLAERAHRAVAAIVDDDDGERQLALRRGPQRLDGIHRRAVADEADGAD